MIFKFKQFMNLEENSKCPPGYKYDPKLKMCLDKNYKRSVMYRPYFGRYLNTQPKQEQPPATNGNGNGNNNNQNSNGNGGNGNTNGNGSNGGGNGNGGGSGGANGAGS